MSDSSSDDDDFNIPIISMEEEFDATERLIVNTINMNNMFINHYSNQQNTQRSHGGSILGHAVVNRDREAADRGLFNDYFADNPIYDDGMFRRRFRMSRNLFLHIVDAVKAHDNYFAQRRDGIGRLGLSTLQKATAVMRILINNVPSDSTDEYVKIGESTTIECVKRFCRAVVETFAGRYLREPTANDIARLLYIGEKRGFPGMLGSLDCMHWQWKNCPTTWASQYSGRSGAPTMILEAVVDYDLWIWHAYFRMPGSNNDINVLESSRLFSNIVQETAPSANYVIEGNEYNMGYYLADNIYPKWSTIVQTIQHPRGPKKKYFAMRQEACRKDVERAFGVLQSRFAITAGPRRLWRKEVLHDIMSACIIMHNMIIEDERDLNAPIQQVIEAPPPDIEMVVDEDAQFQQFIGRYRQVGDRDAHFALRNALIDYLWKNYSNSNV